MVDIGKVYTGNSFKSDDLEDDEPILTIAAINVREFENGKKLAIFFEGQNKYLVCNKTNASRIAKTYGTDTDTWIGKKIQLYVDDVEYQGRTVDGIRVRTTKPAKAAVKPQHTEINPPDPDDDIPF
jgi:hypothetical protein